jgi:hypothetical protein
MNQVILNVNNLEPMEPAQVIAPANDTEGWPAFVSVGRDPRGGMVHSTPGRADGRRASGPARSVTASTPATPPWRRLRKRRQRRSAGGIAADAPAKH